MNSAGNQTIVTALIAAAGVLLAAILAAVVAMRQQNMTAKKNAEDKRREIHDDRREVYDGVRTLLSKMEDSFHGLGVTSEDIGRYSATTHRKAFLFPDEFCAYLDEIFAHAQELCSVNEWLGRFGPENPKWDEMFDEKERLLAWTREQFDDGALQQKFAPYLSLA